MHGHNNHFNLDNNNNNNQQNNHIDYENNSNNKFDNNHNNYNNEKYNNKENNNSNNTLYSGLIAEQSKTRSHNKIASIGQRVHTQSELETFSKDAANLSPN